MSKVLFLDSSPLGVITQPQQTSEVIGITTWLVGCLRKGATVIVPAIVYYEVKRELLRAKKTSGLARLDAFVNATPGRYLALTDNALRLAADLWAKSRQQGQLTAAPTALDIDVILAAQVLSSGALPHDAIVVTSNSKHLSQFINAKHWNDVLSG